MVLHNFEIKFNGRPTRVVFVNISRWHSMEVTTLANDTILIYPWLERALWKCRGRFSIRKIDTLDDYVSEPDWGKFVAIYEKLEQAFLK